MFLCSEHHLLLRRDDGDLPGRSDLDRQGRAAVALGFQQGTSLDGRVRPKRLYKAFFFAVGRNCWGELWRFTGMQESRSITWRRKFWIAQLEPPKQLSESVSTAFYSPIN